ncbi:Mobile element protein [Azospirillum argentinense]
MGKRKRNSTEIKAKMALAAIRGELTVSQLVAKHGVHQMLINAWKKQATEGDGRFVFRQGGNRRSQPSGGSGKLQAMIVGH